MVAALLDRLGVNPALYQQGTQPVYTPIDGSQIGAEPRKTRLALP